MSVSQQTGTEGLASVSVTASGTSEQDLHTFLRAIRSDDGEGIVDALYRVLKSEGESGVATIGAALKASGLTDAMIATLTKRAESLQTPLAWLHLSDAAFAGGEAELGVEAASRALEIDPSSEIAALIVSSAANRRGDYAEALRVISTLAAQVPEAKDNPPIIIQTAVAEINCDQPTAAVALIDASLPRLTEAGLEFDALRLRAVALSAIGERGDEAVTAWERALSAAKHPVQVDYSRNGLVGALIKQKRFDECLPHLNLALENSTNAEERKVLSETRINVLVEKGDIDGALKAADDLLTTLSDPEQRVGLRLQQAHIAAKTGQWKEVAARFDAALTDVPIDEKASERRLNIRMQKAQMLAPNEIEFVTIDLDELDKDWTAPGWPTPIDVRVGGLLSAGRPAEALVWLDQRLAGSSTLAQHPAAHHLRGEILFMLGKTTEAMLEYKRALDVESTVTEPRAWSAKLFSALPSQQWNEAVAAYQTLCQLAPNGRDATVNTMAALAYLRLGDLETALKITDEEVPASPSSLVVRDICRGEAQVRLGLYKDALKTTAAGLQRYQAAQSAKSTPVQPQFLMSLQLLRAQAFNQESEFEAARDAASAAIDVPDSPGVVFSGLAAVVRMAAFMQRSLAHFRLLNSSAAHLDIDQAITEFERLNTRGEVVKVVKQMDDFESFEGALWYAKGAVLDSERRGGEEALAAYTRAEKLEKNGAAAAIARGFALSSTGAFTQATFAFDTALTRASSPKERAEAFEGKGRALVGLKQYEKAIANLQSALDARLTSQNDDPGVFEQLGIAYSSLQRHDAAKRAFTRAWELSDSDKRTANLARGVTAARLCSGEPKAALRFLDKLPRELASDRTLQFNRALALDALGRRRAAIPCFVRAKDLGLDRAQQELDRLDAPAGLGRWTHYWFGAQANRTRLAFGIALAIIAATGLAAPLLQWWVNGKLEWYLLLLPSVVALLLLALPNMKSIGFEGAGLSVSVEPLSATGRDAAAVAAPETFDIPLVGAVSVTTSESKLL